MVRVPAADAPSPSASRPDELKEACGVFAVYGPSLPVAQLCYLGLFALQHRGQEAAGMAVSDGETLTVVKDQGLVASVFDDRTLAGLHGHLAIGHCRYSTTGSSTWRNAQPAYRSVGEHEFALGHNGNLVNTERLAKEAGMLEGMVTSDSDLVAELIANEMKVHPLEDGVTDPWSAPSRVRSRWSSPTSSGSSACATPTASGPCASAAWATWTAREGWVLASESPALDIVGADVHPRDRAGRDGGDRRPRPPFAPGRSGPSAVDPALCLFEFVYFARPDTRLYGRSVHQARIHMGEQLAAQAPVEADMVMGVPESGVPAAEGFAHHSGIPLGQGLVKNRYIGRSFIAPSQELRARAVRMKLNPLKENIAGKRLVVIDDSIVRGTTQRALVRMLREAGATEVHLRISSPPVMWSCFYGIDTGERSELIAYRYDVDAIRRDLDADTLSFLDLDRLVTATGAAEAGYCDACFTGHYPVEVPVSLRKHVLEDNEQPFSEDVIQPVLLDEAQP